MLNICGIANKINFKYAQNRGNFELYCVTILWPETESKALHMAYWAQTSI